MVAVQVKHGKNKYEVEMDLTKDVAAFRAVLHAATKVPPARQSIMSKGGWIGTLKDDKNLSTIKVQAGQLITLMGTADKIVETKMEEVKFVEDMTVEEQAARGVLLSAGLRNMGNTCYMNSTVQCFRHMPELRYCLDTATRPTDANAAQLSNLAFSLNDTCKELDNSGAAVFPQRLIQTMRMQHPQFAEGVMQGRPAQQDADELYNEITRSIEAALSEPSILPASSWESVLGLEMEETLVCTETDAEPEQVNTEIVNKLVCYIQNNVSAGGATQNIDHLHEGVKLALEGQFEKNSAVLGRNAIWNKTARIKKLPRYLCFHFMRFYNKATAETRENPGGQVKCKILRSVKYPETIDIFDLCSASMQEKLMDNRVKEDKQIEASLAKKAKLSEEGNPSDLKEATDKVDKTEPATMSMQVDENNMEELSEDDEALQAAMAMSLDPSATQATIFEGIKSVPHEAPGTVFSEQGLPDGFTGHYELHSIVTHKGRSADGGHYIGWTRQEPGSSKWWCYNDDKVTEIEQAEIMLLCGGGDRDTAYLTFYRFKERKTM